MTWDYYVSIEEEMNQETNELSRLEAQIQNANRQERSRIRRQINQEVKRIHKKWKQDVNSDPTRILASQIVDDISVWWFGDYPVKEKARAEICMPIASDIIIEEPGKIANDLDFNPNFRQLPSPHWLGLQVDFELLTPWYSKDDRIFHVMDNPVRKDRVFGVPFIAASSWKGMLRWAFRMHMKLIGTETEPDEEKRKRARNWELHLFGNEKGEQKDFHRGALVFYPTWFDRIGFEVINPHRRATRAGTQPIYYEVVPPGAKGTLHLLYAPWPGMKPEAKPEEVLPKLLEAIEKLLTTYGISAKRTVGWGTAKVNEWQGFHKEQGTARESQREKLWNIIQNWLSAEGGTP